MTGVGTPTARRDVDAVTVDGAIVIHRDGRIHTLDPLATLVWRCLDGRATVDEIAGDLAPAFAVPVERARRDVESVVGELARLDLLAPAGDADQHSPPAPASLADPPGSCGSCADRTWAHRVGVRVGPWLVTVGIDAAPVVEAVRSALGAHVIEPPATVEVNPPFLGISAPPAEPEPGPRPLYLLHRGDAVLARTRSAGGIVRALAAYLASYADLAPLGLAPVDGLVVAVGDRVLLVPEPDDPIRFRHALVRRGVQVAEVAITAVDAHRAEVVVGAPGLTVDPSGWSEPPDGTLPWGRYPLEALGVDGPPDPSRALLRFAPARADHRDPETGLAALVALIGAVPLVDAAAPDPIAAHLGRSAPLPE